MERAASAHEYAQKLNNLSAACIELGKHDKAIESLGKALKLSELHTTDQLLDRSQACACRDCSLDGCIANSVTDLNLVKLFDISNNGKTKNRKMKESRKRTATDIDEPPILHRRPIRIPKRTIREGHNMGSTLFLIITFNLALAHHLKALKTDSSSFSSSSRNLLLHSTVQLYELANNWKFPSSQRSNNYVTDDDEDDSSEDEDEDEDDVIVSMEKEDEESSVSGANNTRSSSSRFDAIIYDNLNHLNQMMSILARSISSSKRRLNELLSTVATPSVFTTEDDDEERADCCLLAEPELYPPPLHQQPKSATTTNNTHCDNFNSPCRVVSSCELDFEYYDENEEEKFYCEQEDVRRRFRSSSANATGASFYSSSKQDA